MLLRLLYLGLLGFIIMMATMVLDSFNEEPSMTVKIGLALFFGSFAAICVKGVITGGDI